MRTINKIAILMMLPITAMAQPVNLTFPGNLPVSTSTTSIIPMCEVTVAGYKVDTTMMGANLAGAQNTCTADNVLPAVDTGKVTAGPYGTGKSGAQIAVYPPAGVTFNVTSFTVHDYGVNNLMTAYANFADGTYATYDIPAGSTVVTLPSNFSGMAFFEVYNVAILTPKPVPFQARFAIGDIAINDSVPVARVEYNDTWVGNGYGYISLIDFGSTTASGGTIQLWAAATQQVIYTSPTLSFKLQNPAITLNNGVNNSQIIVNATGSTVDQNGVPITVTVTETFRKYKQHEKLHYGVLSGSLKVFY